MAANRSRIAMKTLIVYDSIFGNTKKVAQAMGEALARL